jgi:hypothetical protein
MFTTRSRLPAVVKSGALGDVTAQSPKTAPPPPLIRDEH